jgi:hypothetical protein
MILLPSSNANVGIENSLNLTLPCPITASHTLESHFFLLFLSFALSLTHTLSHTLSLTHTHSLSLSLSLFFLCFSFALVFLPPSAAPGRVSLSKALCNYTSEEVKVRKRRIAEEAFLAIPKNVLTLLSLSHTRNNTTLG